MMGKLRFTMTERTTSEVLGGSVFDGRGRAPQVVHDRLWFAGR